LEFDGDVGKGGRREEYVSMKIFYRQSGSGLIKGFGDLELIRKWYHSVLFGGGTN